MKHTAVIGLPFILLAPLLTWAEPATRIYVKTTPTGAHVLIDGKEVGDSDDLYDVSAGRHDVAIEKSAYLRHSQQVDVKAGNIERVVIQLKLKPGAAAAAQAYIEANRPQAAAMREAMVKAVTAASGDSAWSGEIDGTLFAIATVPLATNLDVRRETVADERSHIPVVAIGQLVANKALMAKLKSSGPFVDDDALKKALSDQPVNGRVVGMIQQGDIMGDFAVGWAAAKATDIEAAYVPADRVKDVMDAYRGILRSKAMKLKSDGKVDEALISWKHLFATGDTSESFYIEVARCYLERHAPQPQDAFDVLQEGLTRHPDSSSTTFCADLVNLAKKIQTPEADALAKRASDQLEKLSHRTIPGASRPETSPGK